MLLYVCESWTLTSDRERRIQALENKCYMKMLGVSYNEHNSNEYVYGNMSKSSPDVNVKCHKLSWFGHVCRHDTLPTNHAYNWEQYNPRYNIIVAEGNRVNHGNITSKNGQASHCRRCYTHVPHFIFVFIFYCNSTYLSIRTRMLDRRWQCLTVDNKNSWSPPRTLTCCHKIFVCFLFSVWYAKHPHVALDSKLF